jgi:Tfp pilus assembly protein PilN
MTKSIEDDIIVLKQQAILEIPNQTELSAIEESITLLKARIEVTDVAMNSIKWANCARLLQEIRALVPGTLWLTNLRWQEDRNVVFGGYALSYDSVFKFRRSLIESPYFGPVKLIFIRSTELAGKSIEQFEIQCGVKTETMGGGAKSSGTI